jgi:hypothetical protein
VSRRDGELPNAPLRTTSMNSRFSDTHFWPQSPRSLHFPKHPDVSLRNITLRHGPMPHDSLHFHNCKILISLSPRHYYTSIFSNIFTIYPFRYPLSKKPCHDLRLIPIQLCFPRTFSSDFLCIYRSQLASERAPDLLLLFTLR